MTMQESGVAVWCYSKQCFVHFIPCPGEKRVRVDAGMLSDFAVYKAVWKPSGEITLPSLKPLKGWAIDYT